MASFFLHENNRKKPQNFQGAGNMYQPFMMTHFNNISSKRPLSEPELPLVRQEQMSPSYKLFDEKTCSGQMAFINKLLEDTTEDGNVSKTNLSSFSTLSEKVCFEDESIGQLAIKLADLALAEAKVASKPKHYQEVQQRPNMNFGVPNIHHQTVPTHVKNNPGKKTQGFYNKKKKFPSGVNDARYLPNHKFKSFTSPHHYSGAPFWIDGAKSDGGSLSSNSSLHRESINHFSADLMKYKMYPPNYSDDDNDLSPQPLRRSRKSYSTSSSSSGGRAKFSECVLCKTNGETPAMYRSHVLKDERGRTVCQVLQRYVCPLCGATGTSAHTVKYCPKNKNPPQVATMTTLKAMRSSTGRKRYGQIRPVPFGFSNNTLSA